MAASEFYIVRTCGYIGVTIFDYHTTASFGECKFHVTMLQHSTIKPNRWEWKAKSKERARSWRVEMFYFNSLDQQDVKLTTWHVLCLILKRFKCFFYVTIISTIVIRNGKKHSFRFLRLCFNNKIVFNF